MLSTKLSRFLSFPTRCFAVLSALLLAFLLAMGTGPLAAQEITGTILGTISDSTGALVPGAKVTITNVDRNAVLRTVKTGNAGEYSAPLLPVGQYLVTIEAAGFKKTTQTGITLNVNDKRTVNAALEVGGNDETVSVQANALQVNTESDAATGLITGTQVRELALQSRNYEELVQLMPGVSADIGDALYAGVSSPNGGTNETAFSLNGSFGSANSWTVDGADNVDRGGNFSLLNYPSVDAIEEFKVLRGNYNAEYGRSAGGVINVITRSGTSKFHGGAYEFFRNDILDANDWSNKQQSPAADRTPFRYNDFGWTLGGPVFIPHVYNEQRNKTFFFYSEELRRIVQQNPVTGVVPDANERTGNFENPVCSVYPNSDGSCSGQVITNISQVGVINPAAAAYLKDVYSHLPLPTTQSQDILFSNQANIFNFQQEIGRIDHIFTPNLSGFVRYMQDSIPTVEGGGLFNGNPLPNVAQTSTNSPGQNVAANLTWTITPSMLNEVEYAWSYGAIRSHNIGQLAAGNSPDVAGAIALPFAETLDRIPSIGFGQANASFFGFGTYGDFNKNNAFFDNLTKTVGKHSLKFGVSYNHYEKSENSASNNAGTFSFAATPFAGAPASDQKAEFEQEFALFLLGQSSQFTQSAKDFRAVIFQNQIEFYGQDSWKARPNLTLSFGLRYSLFRQPTDGNAQATNFVPSRYVAGNAPAIDNGGNVCTAATQPCDTSITGAGSVVPNPNYDPINGIIIGGSGNGAHNSPYSTAIAPQFHNGWQPRVGFSFDPWNDGKTAVRGGYGIFVESPGIGFLENNEFINPPFVGNTTINGAPFNNPASGSLSNNSVQSVGGVSTNWHQPYAQQWDLDVQRQIPYDIILDVGYYGSKGTHQLSQVDINQPVPGAYANNTTIEAGLGAPPLGVQQMTSDSQNLLNLIRPFQGYGPIDIYEPIFSSNYNSLQSSLQKRFKAGSLVGVNYTWSKSLTNRPDQAGGNLPVPQNTANLGAEYGPSRFDRRNVFNANWVYELPFFTEQHGLVGHALGGWEFSGIVQAQSGQWLSAIGNSSVDPGGLGVFTSATAPNDPRPDQVGKPNSHAPHTIAQWYNTAAFADVPSNEFRPGNAPRATILGPGSQRWDLSMLKNVKIFETQSFQFRAEAFNVWNHTNYNNVDTTQDDGLTGQVLGAGEKRILQVALKYNF
jgi:outer membrane receptor protein involved in Fe transport